jgi:hypothetical protein
VVRNKKWYLEPWVVEEADPKFMSYSPSKKAVPGEDGDAEVIRDKEAPLSQVCSSGEDVENLDAENLLPTCDDDVVILEDEARHVLRDMLNVHENQVHCPNQRSDEKISPTIEYDGKPGKVMFKSTLVSELNGNPFLSKDRLTQVRNSVYLNNVEEYMLAANSKNTCFLGLGSDCAVYFVSNPTGAQSFAARAAKKRNGCRRVGAPSSIGKGTLCGSWWLGRVQKIRRKVGQKWGLFRYPFDLMNRNSSSGRKGSAPPEVMVLLNWFSKSTRNCKFKYDVSDSQWIDIDMIISTVSLSFQSINSIYVLDSNDANQLNDFVASRR